MKPKILKRCPACGILNPPTYTSGKRNFRQHIRKKAEAEALRVALNLPTFHRHLNYFKSHLRLKVKESTIFTVEI